MNSVEISDVVSPADHAAIKSGLDRHAVLNAVEPRVSRPLSVMMYDDSRQLIAGLEGQTFWNGCYIDTLWVTPDLRKKGLGRELVSAAEKEAEKRGCTIVYLFTHDYEAPGFYEKLGYRKFFAINDLPTGHVRTGFMKQKAA